MRDYDRNYDTMSRDRYDRGRNNDRFDRDDRDRGGLFGWGDDNERSRYSENRNTDRDRTSGRYNREDSDRGGMFGWGDDNERARYSDNRNENRESGWFSDRDEHRDQGRRGMPRNETDRLIASDKVEGTPVYGRDRDKLGSIHNFMVEKRSGKARYAVMKTSSGFLGLDERYYPLEWNELTYDTRVDGYHIDMSEDELERRRSFDSRGRPTGIEGRRENGETRFRRDRDSYERSTW